MSDLIVDNFLAARERQSRHSLQIKVVYLSRAIMKKDFKCKKIIVTLENLENTPKNQEFMQ
jgi:hypothetical protein